MNAWYENTATAILHGVPDLDTDEMKISLRVIAATLTIRRDGSNSEYSAFTHLLDDPGMAVTR